MTDFEKYDSAEADRVMELLRLQLAEQEKVEEKAEAPSVEPQADDVSEAAVTASEEKNEDALVEEENTAPDEDAPVVAPEIPIEEGAAPAEAGEKTRSDAAESAEERAAEPFASEVPEGIPQKSSRPRKKRRRVPKLEDIEKQVETPLDNAAREAARQRAAAFLHEQESDLFWRRTAEGKTPLSSPKNDPMPRVAEKPTTPLAPVAPRTTSEEPFEPTIVSRRKGIRDAKPSAAERELMADITVEGILNDIFGGVAGPGGRAWLAEEKKEAATDESAAGPAPEEAVSDPMPQSEAQEPGVADGNAPTLELGGYRILLPEEEGVTVAKKEKGEGAKLFSAFSVKRQREGALPKPSIARPSADQIAFKHKMEESEEDFRLLIDLDYENELGETIGFEKILDYHERHINGRGVTYRTGKKPRRDRQRQEYTTHGQDIGLSKFYAKQRRRHVTRLVLTCVLMLVLFVYERSAALRSLFGEAPIGARYPTLYVAVGLLLFLGGVALVGRDLLRGLAGLFRMAPTDYSVCSVGVLATLAYHVVLFLVPAKSGLSLYLSPATGSLCLLALSDLFHWYCEFSAFRVISSKRQKYALLPRVSVGNREGNAQLRLFQNEQNERVLYARPVGFVRNYFTNTEKKIDHQSAYGAGLLLVTALSCAVALFVYALGRDAGRALHSAFVAFLLSTPVISVLGTSLPMFFATCLRLGKHAAIVGEGPVYDCSANTTVVIPDSDCFKEMPHEQFELVKNCDAERATVLIRALLERIGSPLVDTVHVPKDLRLSPDAVTLTDIDEGGVAAVVSGERKTPILFGSVAYLQKYGIRVSPKKDGRYEALCRNMLCVAIHNRLTALFIARYRAEDELPSLIEELESEGIGVKIRSKDPGVNDEMLADLFPNNTTPPKVMKPLVSESEIATDRMDATVVSLGSPRECARTLGVCRCIRRAIKLGTMWQFISIFCGAIIAGALVFFDHMAALPPYAVALYTFLFSGAHALTSYFILCNKDENT